MQRIGIISNPYSRAFQKNPHINTRLKQILKNDGHLHVTKDIQELKDVCQEFKDRHIDLIGLCGGDGSISLCLTELHKAYRGLKLPKIFILGGGTINILARNLNRSNCPQKNLARLLKNLKRRQEKHKIIKGLEIEGRLGFLYADGLAPCFLKEFYKKKKSHLSAFLFLFEVFFDGLFFGGLTHIFLKIFKVQNLKISYLYNNQKKALEGNYPLLLASTLQKMPYGLKVFKKTKNLKDSARFIAYSGSKFTILRDFLKVFVSSNLNNARDDNFESITITSKFPYDYTLDGEIYRAQSLSLDIKTGPRFYFLML